MNISCNEYKTASYLLRLDALNNKDISYAKDFFLYIETQLKLPKIFELGEKYQISIARVKFFAFIGWLNLASG
ncbi:hypothetical protein F6P94_17385 [Escherichia coli]|nr:hypothetical protein F6P94_17385 [Escherichia coli]